MGEELGAAGLWSEDFLPQKVKPSETTKLLSAPFLIKGKRIEY